MLFRSEDIGCLVKWGFQALAEEDRFGFLFDNVDGGTIPVATGALGASIEAYALGLGVEPAEINAKWEHALCNPVAPVLVDDAPCHEVVLEGSDVDLGALPIPVWTPGKDAGRYVTAVVVTRDADSGTQNYGVYRTQILGPDRMVSNLSPGRQGTRCVQSWHARGEPAPFALVIGAEPAMYYASVTTLPFSVDEATLAGGLKQEALEVVRGRSVELDIPARTEIVIEGFIDTRWLEPEAPFGESHGYVNLQEYNAFMDVTAITRRRNPILTSFISQVTPSESKAATEVARVTGSPRSSPRSASKASALSDHAHGLARFERFHIRGGRHLTCSGVLQHNPMALNHRVEGIVVLSARVAGTIACCDVRARRVMGTSY